MAVLKVTKYGHPVLHKKAKPVKEINDEIRKLIKDMFATMYASGGVGLAAPQVGVPLQLSVINITPGDRKNQFVIINPKIVKKEGKQEGEEGCLSLPGVGGARFRRAAKVTVEALNEKGLPVTIKGEGLLARCLQHEIDHMNAKMILHRASLRQRFKMMFAVRRLKKEGLW